MRGRGGEERGVGREERREDGEREGGGKGEKGEGGEGGGRERRGGGGGGGGEGRGGWGGKGREGREKRQKRRKGSGMSLAPATVRCQLRTKQGAFQRPHTPPGRDHQGW